MMETIPFDTTQYRDLVYKLHQFNEAKKFIRYEISAAPLRQLVTDPEFRALAEERLGEDLVHELQSISSAQDLRLWSMEHDKAHSRGLLVDVFMGPARPIPGINFLYAFSGRLLVTLDEEHSFILEKGQTAIFDLEVSHGVTAATEDGIPISLILFKPYLTEMIGSNTHTQPLFNEFYSRAFYPGNRHRDYLIVDTRQDSHIYYYFIRGLYEFTYKRPFSISSVDVCVSELLISLMRSYSLFFVEDSSHPALTDQVRDILDYIDRNLSDVTLNSAAKAFHFSANHLNRIVKSNTGRTFLDLVHKARMREAGYLLRTPGITVTEAASLVGYNNMSYFYKLFVREYHMNPQSYRETAGVFSEKFRTKLQNLDDAPTPPGLGS